MSQMSKKRKHGMVIGAAISMALVACLVFNQTSCSTTKANTNLGTTSEVVDVTRSQEVCYEGDYYNELANVETLLSDQYSSQDVKLGLRALIGYQSQTTYVEAFGKNIVGTDVKHPRYKGTKDGSLAVLWQESERKELNEKTPGGCFRLFYTNVYGTSLGDYSGAVNREHVWPQSLSGGLFGTSGAGADAHHIRPCNQQLNGARSNKKYGDLEEAEIEYTYFTSGNQAKNFNQLHDYYTADYVSNSYNGEISGYSTETVFEPRDDYKGDIARIIAYMALHYESLEGIVDNVMDGGYETIIEWNKLDPVDDYEMNRNNVVEDYQGNRNPFIDEPELIDKIWGSNN